MPIGSISNGNNKTLEIEDWSLIPQIGDKWTQVDSTGQPIEKWTWNGVFWISKPLFSLVNAIRLTSTSDVIISINKDNNLLIDKITIDYSISGVNDTNRRWNFELLRVSDSFSLASLGSINSLPNLFASKQILINQQDNLLLTNTIYYLLRITRVGNAGTLSLTADLNYRKTKES